MATEVIRSKHYNDEIEIKFYPNSHRYQKEGEKTFLIGVTTATGMVDKSRPLLIWSSRLTEEYLTKILNFKPIEPEDIAIAVNQYNEKRDEAADKGTQVHRWAEAYIQGENPDTPEDEQVRNGALAFLKWVDEKQVKFLSSEKMVYSKKHNYVGTMDVIFTMGTEDHKIIHAGDFKTSSSIYLEHVMQVVAYQEAEREEFGTEYGSPYILRFDKDTGEFHSKEFADNIEEYFEGFLACLKLKELSKFWEKTHGYYSSNKK